jgi:hypothetical protein
MTWAANIHTLERNVADGIAPNTPAASVWDRVGFGEEHIVSPGVAKVTVTSRSNLDVQKPKGGKRATVVDQGDPPLEFSIEIVLLPDEMEDFCFHVLPILRPRSAKGARQALRFHHPTTFYWCVQDIIVDSIDMSHPEPGGTVTVRVKAIEWFPEPKPVKKTVKKPAPTVKIPTDGSPSAFLTDPLAATPQALALTGANPVNPFAGPFGLPPQGE